MNKRLKKHHPLLFKNPPAKGIAARLFREGVVWDWILKVLAYHKCKHTLIDFAFLEGDDATLHGVSTKCVYFR